MSKKIAALLIAAVAGAAPLYAASNSAQLSVSVQVIARTILTIDTQPATVDVTADDIARGYVELPQSVLFHVRSNAVGGYAVQFEPLTYPFARADINWDNTLTSVSVEGAWVTRSYQQGTTTGAFNVRLTLAPGTQPGTYAWPIQIAANSL